MCILSSLLPLRRVYPQDFEYSFSALFELFQSDAGYSKQLFRSGWVFTCRVAQSGIAEDYVGRHASLPGKLGAKFAQRFNDIWIHRFRNITCGIPGGNRAPTC